MPLLKGLREIKGKTIKKAEVFYAEFGDRDNRGIQLEFTDGSSFSFNVDAICKAESMYFEDESDKEPKRRRL